MERLLWYLFAGSRGGPTRIRIVQALLDRPDNLNRLAKRLGLDYKTVDHNLRVLMKHVVVVCPDAGTYGATYHTSKNLMANLAVFHEIVEKADKGRRSGTKKGSATGPGVVPREGQGSASGAGRAGPKGKAKGRSPEGVGKT